MFTKDAEYYLNVDQISFAKKNVPIPEKWQLYTSDDNNVRISNLKKDIECFKSVLPLTYNILLETVGEIFLAENKGKLTRVLNRYNPDDGSYYSYFSNSPFGRENLLRNYPKFFQFAPKLFGWCLATLELYPPSANHHAILNSQQ